MASDDEFKPRLGRIRARGSGRKFLHRVLAAANLARGGSNMGRGHGRFTGSRMGRGAGVGAVLGGRDRFAAFRARRVIVKSRIVRLAGKGSTGARAHLRYIQRDGTTRDGAPGQLYDATRDRAEGKKFLERSANDRHQFRFIVSPEDGADYEDLKPLTRRLMARMEEDLGTRLEWVAVDHFNTGRPHTHIMLRGKDEAGRDLIIARDYIQHGMRERAAELVDLDLGPRSDRAIEDRLRAEVEQERMTSIDRALLKGRGDDGLVGAVGRDPFDQSIRMGRLQKLKRLGLAHPESNGRWRLAPNLAEALTRMSERGDIIRTMQRALAAKGRPTALAEQAIYEPGSPDAKPLVGRLIERGLSDELNDRHYLIVEATDGRTHFTDLGPGDAVEAFCNGSILRIEPAVVGIREADRTVSAIAAANDGRYDVDAHLKADPSATEEYALAHVRRLEAIRRLTGGVERAADGSWIIAADHLERAAEYEAARAKNRPVRVTMLSSVPLERLTNLEGATWLDQDLIADTPLPLRDAGFGQEVQAAKAARRQWLVAHQFAQDQGGETVYRPDMIEQLRRRELLRIAGQLSEEMGMPFVESEASERIEGRLVRAFEGSGGRYALIQRSRDFTLVPWRSVLERHVGKNVSGVMRSDGVSWTIGRGRNAPTID